jgi:hypothetical protein
VDVASAARWQSLIGMRNVLADRGASGMYTGPGAVARCRTCGNVVFVLVKIRGATALHAEAFELPAPA